MPLCWLEPAQVLDVVAVFCKRLGHAWRSRSSSAGEWRRGLGRLCSAVTALPSVSQSPSVLDAMCAEDADCPVGKPVDRGNGTECFATKIVLIPHALQTGLQRCPSTPAMPEFRASCKCTQKCSPGIYSWENLTATCHSWARRCCGHVVLARQIHGCFVADVGCWNRNHCAA